MDEWICIFKRVTKQNSRIEVKIGNVTKRMYYTAGMKGDDLRFTHWRYVGYEDLYNKLKPYLNYGERNKG